MDTNWTFFGGIGYGKRCTLSSTDNLQPPRPYSLILTLKIRARKQGQSVVTKGAFVPLKPLPEMTNFPHLQYKPVFEIEFWNYC